MPAHWISSYDSKSDRRNVDLSDDDSSVEVLAATGTDEQQPRAYSRRGARLHVVHNRTSPSRPGKDARIDNLPSEEHYRPEFRIAKSMAAAEKLPPAVGLMGWHRGELHDRAGHAWPPSYEWVTQ